MQNYIIISIIIAIIIFFLYKKNNKFEHFDNPIINLESLNNLFSTFVNPKTVSFNNIIANNINTEELNKKIVVNIDLSSNIEHGEVLRYDATKKIWKNYKTVFPHYLYLNFFFTLRTVGGRNTADNSVLRNNLFEGGATINTIARLNELLKKPPGATIPLESSFAWRAYEFPDNNLPHHSSGHSEYGLRYDRVNARISKFDPKKTYKIDCTLTLYRAFRDNKEDQVFLSLRSSSTHVEFFRASASLWVDGLTQVINLKTIKKGLPPSIYFDLWTYGKLKFDVDGARQFNTNFTIFIQEMTDTLQAPISQS
jgi:hypothetical protein